jgi:hypothetical protein
MAILELKAARGPSASGTEYHAAGMLSCIHVKIFSAIASRVNVPPPGRV